MIKVVIVDDSAFMRKALQKMIEKDSQISVVATGKNGLEAVELAKKHKPDVMTLDVEMPKMDGLQALKKIMKVAPTKVIMVSSLTKEGANETLEAMDIGAVDFIPKNLSFVSLDIVKIKKELINKIKIFSKKSKKKTKRKKIKKRRVKKKRKKVSREKPKGVNLITIGVSTGGPPALQKLIPNISKNINIPVMVVQHMPASFTGPLAKRLNSLSSLKVKEASNGEILKKNTVYIAPGGKHMRLKNKNTIEITDDRMGERHIPSVNVMVESVNKYYSNDLLGVILTGMGKDGFKSLKNVSKKGSYIIAQDEKTSVVFGMPKAAIEGNIANEVLSIDKIAGRINKLVK